MLCADVDSELGEINALLTTGNADKVFDVSEIRARARYERKLKH